MNKKEVLKKTTKYLSKDLMVAAQVVLGFMVVLYVMGTILISLIWWSTSGSVVWLKIWEPWAISIAHYWTVGNLILAFLAWVGYRTYQAIKTA